ncbi:conserved Plasmodium protein, unknown function [Plasmodium knowlesi strain H]|uniref:Uncharacterized protein n=3 Tax=Plasmodium knowlesi TaxID=5850 RepID=A0A5E7X640_PLAKH|nr:conserved protein, unknown function [Plasmodium knowlesi strain H]OTN67636.1 Uncharacterized protein PKNOH_S05385500 [Plasmodium knowlesi]CAA9990442.1 conserved protein, unknown function [Plasmodium knowlesi strain H]SBO19648.1 conserved Plasmodium protein, unknown function [Plasmodium knowlesi strain H]SBO22538.1 conserved Plasmodium protein, unknown function [Plasmodium knowlesi strain H]VVS79916.1 conserved protein, unknown function [Plasmodium knowlesi strain H]
MCATMNMLNKDTILLKTKKLKNLCENEENINSQHLKSLIEILEYFFETYNDFFLSSVVWEVVDKIIILENTIEEKKNIDVDLRTSIKFCEFIFNKLIAYTNYECENLKYLFSFSFLRRHLCSVLSSFLNCSSSSFRRKVESSFTTELLTLTKQIFEKIKVENDLELKVCYTEFLWRSFRRIDFATFNIKGLHANIKTLEKLKYFKIFKFDEECINWLKEENYMDTKIVIDDGLFTIRGNKKYVNKDFILCYLGKCSIFLYYDNPEEDEKCKIEVPYYHITSVHFDGKHVFTLDCKAIIDQTNIFSLWGQDIRDAVDYESINKFTLSLDIKKNSKEVKNFLDKISVKLKKEAKKSKKEEHQKRRRHDKEEKEDSDGTTVTSENNAKEELDDHLFLSNSSNTDQDINDKQARHIARNGVKPSKGEEKKRNKKTRKKEAKDYKLKYEMSSDEKNYTRRYKTESDLKKKTESESPLEHYNLGANISQTHIGRKNAQERDSDTDVIIQKIISRHNENKEIFKKALKQGFSDAVKEIDSNIKALVEKQKSRRHEFHKKYEKKKKNMITVMEKEISMLTREINALTESLKKIGVNKSEVLKLYEEGKFILPSSELLQKSQAIIKRVKENLQKMNSDILGKEKEYNKRKKLCFKALATAYE